MDIIPLDRFQEKLKEELQDIKRETRKQAWSDLLSHWTAQHFLQLDKNQCLRACGMQGSGEEGIDLFWVEDGGKRVVVDQAETDEDLNLQETFSRRLVDKLRRALNALNDSELAANRQSPIASCIEEYTTAVSKGYSVEFWIIISGAEDSGLEKAARRFENVDLKNYPKHSLRIINSAALLTKYCANIEKLPYPDIELHVPREEFFKHNDNSLLATVTGQSVVDVVRNKGLHIFETNARLPLLRSTINAEIGMTVSKPDGRENFWNFNNGMTILCEDFSEIKKGKIIIKNAQIVNGCQTAFTLSKNESKLEDVEVICRIIRRAPRSLSERIRRATNLQNAIIERDLRSGDVVQKSLQISFRNRGYFYERKRDEYKNCVAELGKANMSAQFPKGEIDNLYLSQLALSFWHEKPAPAKMEQRRIFVKSSIVEESELPQGFYDIVFHDGVSGEEMLLPYLVSNYLYNEFSIGYRPQGANRTRKYMIQTHGNLTVLALVGLVIRKKYSFHLPVKGQKQQVLKVLLLPRFEDPDDYPEFFEEFRKVVSNLLKALDRWVLKTAQRQKREIGAIDIRKIFISSASFDEIVSDSSMRSAISKAQKNLPPLN